MFFSFNLLSVLTEVANENTGFEFEVLAPPNPKPNAVDFPSEAVDTDPNGAFDAPNKPGCDALSTFFSPNVTLADEPSFSVPFDFLFLSFLISVDAVSPAELSPKLPDFPCSSF